MSNEAQAILRTLVGDARAGLAELRAGGADSDALREACVADAQNIAMAAELAGLEPMSAEAQALVAQLEAQLEAGAPPDDGAAAAACLDAWAAALGDADAVHDDAEAPGGGGADARQAGALAAAGSPTGSGHDLLPMLAGELRGELEDLGGGAGAPAQAELAARLATACGALGLDGLRQVFVVLADNLPDAGAAAPAWSGPLLDYLEHAGDPGRSHALAAMLRNAAWPRPLPRARADALLTALAEQRADETDAEPGPARPERAAATDVALTLSPDLQPELLEAFLQEAPVHAAELAEQLQRLSAGGEVTEPVRVAQRLAHTLKGAGNLIGARGVANLAHHLEDVLEALGSAGTAPPAPLAEVLLQAADCMEAMVEALQGRAPPPGDALAVLQRVLDLAHAADRGGIASAPLAVTPESHAGAHPAQPPADAQGAETVEPAAGAPSQPHLRVPARTIDEMFRIAGEVSIGASQIQDRIRSLLREGEALRQQDLTVQKGRLELENQVGVRNLAAVHGRTPAAAEDGFDALEMDRYDALYDSTHAFIEAVIDMREMGLELERRLRDLDELFVHQQRLNSELQEAIVATRMVPVSTLNGRLQRTVRQASRALKRPVELDIHGTSLAIDNDVLSAIADPLMHILRNAVDHGIESPAEREAAGKAASGRIELSFRQEGNYVAVRVADDGRGVDYAAVAESARRRGLLDEAHSADPAQLRRFLLLPGFSTRRSATQLSGRGVGMDVVHAAVSALKGDVEIVDGAPCGTEVHLRLPLTLIAHHCLLLESGGERLAVPTYVLEQIVPPEAGTLEDTRGALRFLLGDDAYPARRLTALLGQAPGEGAATVLVRVDHQTLAVVVDRVLESRDLVLKNLGRYFKTLPGLAGVAVLGDGGVVPVLDLPAMLRAPLPVPVRATTDAAVPAPPAQHQVLIVDDSLSVRRALSQLLRDAGFGARAARDGLEAMRLLEQRRADIILADLEMPRMNGLELTRQVRADPALRATPIVMITSRGMSKHRRSAERAGVDLYLHKPFSDDQLLAHVERLLAGAAA